MGITGIFWLKDIKRYDTPQLRDKIFKRIAGSDRSIGSIFKSVIEEVTTASGFERCCVKFPVYVNHIPDLLTWYPNCKIIHITRDPRAIAISRTNDPGGAKIKINKHKEISLIIKKGMMAFVTLQYIWTSFLHKRFQHLPNYKLLKYEYLLEYPEAVLRNLCDFLDLEFSSQMLFPKDGEYAQHSSITGKQITSFDLSAAYRWESVINRLDKFVVTMLTKHSMQMFGYRRFNFGRPSSLHN